MYYLDFIILILILMIAVLCRKNNSKYKDGNRWPFYIFLSISDVICSYIHINYEKIGSYLNNIYLIPDCNEKNAARKYVVELVAKALVGSVIVCLIGVSIRGVGTNVNAIESNEFERQGYDGQNNVYSLKLTKNDKTEVYNYVISPVKFTEEQFEEKVNQINEELKVSILGDNLDCEHIDNDMNLLNKDASGKIHISWTSSLPEVLSSDGHLNNLVLTKSIDVQLRAVFTYDAFETTKYYNVIVLPEESNDSDLTAAKNELERIEANSACDKSFSIPDEIDGVTISLEKEEKNYGPKVLVVGSILCMMYVIISISKLKEKSSDVVNSMNNDYVEFVDSLSLLIESGMTIKMSLAYISEQSVMCEKMLNELKYALNKIDAGYDEAYVYELLGQRIGISEYVKLFGYLSQNLKMGNSNLRTMMNNSAYEATQVCKEQIRKNGEKISTKLLLPMVMLLMDVMLIIIIPVVMTF